MPVIGRLDSQVNDVLIEPVGKQRHRGEHGERDERVERAEPRSTHDDARPAAGEDARGDAEGAGDGARDDAHGSARRADRLPVWLL